MEQWTDNEESVIRKMEDKKTWMIVCSEKSDVCFLEGGR